MPENLVPLVLVAFLVANGEYPTLRHLVVLYFILEHTHIFTFQDKFSRFSPLRNVLADAPI